MPWLSNADIRQCGQIGSLGVAAKGHDCWDTNPQAQEAQCLGRLDRCESGGLTQGQAKGEASRASDTAQPRPMPSCCRDWHSSSDAAGW
jgi:hypothetical protein